MLFENKLVVRVAWSHSMSHSSAPIPGEHHPFFDKIRRELRFEVWHCLHVIEDCIDRIDPPTNAIDLAEADLKYVRKQVQLIVTNAMDVLSNLSTLIATGEALAKSGIPSAEEQARILDEIDDVVLPCEGGDE